MLGLSKKSRLKLKEEFGLAVDTLEVPASAKTWKSITHLGYLVGGYFVSLHINLEKVKPNNL